MNTKQIAFFSFLLLLLTFVSAAQAKGLDRVNVKANVNADVETRVPGNSTSTEAKSSVHGNATSTAAKNNEPGNATSSEARAGVHGNATSTNTSAGGQLTAEAHRSTVASFVKSLLAVADRDGGIGAEVRVIALSQADSASTSASAIAKVEGRGNLRNLFLGDDYKSLGDLRSEMATTSANIAKLKNLLERATSDSERAELSAEIQALEASQAKIEAFLEAHESSFSLFGWLRKIFTT